jgi:tRNA(Ile)-lysidine synthase
MGSSKRLPDADPGVRKVRAAVEAVLDRVPRVGPDEPLAVVVGLSGGIDSVVLLDVLCLIARDRALSITALHVDHGLSPNSAAWTRFCVRICAVAGVPLEVHVVKVGTASSIEAQAREARLRAFRAAAGRWLALAHHRDDQAETVLLRLLRGAGVAGLAAMRAVQAPRAADTRAVIRPLLAVSRERIAAYASARKLAWIEDESNAREVFRRNFLRLRVFPALARRFPGFPERLARTAVHMAEASELLDGLAAADRRTVARTAGLDVAALGRLGRSRAKNVLRAEVQRTGARPPDAVQVEEALDQLLTAGADRHPVVALGTLSLHRRGGHAVVSPCRNPTPADWSMDWNRSGTTRMDDLGGEVRVRRTIGAGIALGRCVGHEWVFRLRSGGERFRPDANRPARTLKNLLRESSVPAGERGQLPLLYAGDCLVWVPGIGVAVGWQARAGAPGIMPAWRRDRGEGR